MGDVWLQGMGHLRGAPSLSEGVTHVFGLNCHPCVRTVPIPLSKDRERGRNTAAELNAFPAKG